MLNVNNRYSPSPIDYIIHGEKHLSIGDGDNIKSGQEDEKIRVISGGITRSIASMAYSIDTKAGRSQFVTAPRVEEKSIVYVKRCDAKTGFVK